MQPDTQREGPAYKLGQGATRNNRGGKGSNIWQGGEPTTTKNQERKQRGPTKHGEERNRDREAPKNTQAEAPD